MIDTECLIILHYFIFCTLILNRVDIVRKVLEIQVKVILEVESDVNMLLNKFILRDINAYKESLLL